MKVKVSITDSHIQNGKRQNPYECPIALALWNTGFCAPVAGRTTIYVCKGLKTYTGNTPKKAQLFIDIFDKFDGKDRVKPFTFNLNLKEVRSNGKKV